MRWKPQKSNLLLCLILGVSAAVPRFWHLTQLGLTHFDEGSYTMAGKWLATLGKEGWFFQAGQAPGLFPTLVGLFFWLFGIQDYVAISVSALAGTLTAGLLFALGREWFGRKVGVLAALFLATCEYHLIYSRMALTDALFTLLFWAALALLFHGVRNQSRLGFILGGVVTGLCWNTKYHGFFPLLIVGLWLLGTALDQWRKRGGGFVASLQPRRFGLAVSLAVLTYLPWFLSVVFTVGYGSVLRGQLNHSLGSGRLILTPPAALYFYLTHWLSPILLFFALVGFVRALIDRSAAALFLMVIFGFFAGSALLYLSFPRLILPLVPAVCLFGACGIVFLSRKTRWIDPGIALTACALAVVVWNLAGARGMLTLKTDSYRQAAAYLQSFNEPLLTELNKNFYFYEREKKSKELRWQTLEELDRLIHDSPSILIAVDPILRRLPERYAWFERLWPRLTLLRSFPLRIYKPAYFQGFDPNQGFENATGPVTPYVPGKARIDVYRLQN